MEVEVVERVRRSGLSATRGRTAVLNFLARHPHSTAAEVHAGIADRLMTLTMQSVHNAVNDLTDKGLLRRIDLQGASRYEVSTADNHHHIRCVACGRIEDVDCVRGTAPCLHPEPTDLMPVLLSADVTFQALCATCTDRDRSLTDSRHHQWKGRP